MQINISDFSYKKLNWRPINIDHEKLRWVRKLFISRVSRLLEGSPILISIDESSFGHTIHKAYGWAPIGKRREVQDFSFSGSSKMIAAIMSDGNYFWRISNSNTNTAIFVEFLSDFRKALALNESYSQKRLVAIIDNASYHRSSTSFQMLSRTFSNVIFLPQYSPQFAPIELFFLILKSKMRSLELRTSVNLSKEQGREVIQELVRNLEPYQIIGWFSKTIRQIREDISK